MGRQTRLDPRLDAAMAWDAVARTPGDHREFLARLLHTAANSVRASSGSAFLVDGRGALREAAVVQDGRLWDSEDSASCLQDSYAQGLAGWTITERKAGFVSDTARDDRWVRREWETTSRSALCVPLLAGRTVIGALTVCAPGRDAFSQAELALLMTMAGMLSLNGKEFKEELAPPTGIVQPSLHEIQEEALQ